MKQIVIQPQVVGFCRFHERIDDCTRLRALGRIGKEPSLATPIRPAVKRLRKRKSAALFFSWQSIVLSTSERASAVAWDPRFPPLTINDVYSCIYDT